MGARWAVQAISEEASSGQREADLSCWEAVVLLPASCPDAEYEMGMVLPTRQAGYCRVLSANWRRDERVIVLLSVRCLVIACEMMREKQNRKSCCDSSFI